MRHIGFGKLVGNGMFQYLNFLQAIFKEKHPLHDDYLKKPRQVNQDLYNTVHLLLVEFLEPRETFILRESFALGKTTQTVTLAGRWCIKQGQGVSFEVKYKGNQVQGIKFAVEAKLKDKTKLTFKLKRLGVEVQLARKLLKGDGEWFVRLLKDSKHSAAFVGLGFRW